MHRSNSAELLNKDARHRFSRRGLFLVAASAASAFFQLTDRLHAVTVDTWTNTSGGSWTLISDSDWSQALPPASGQSVDIGTLASSTVDVNYDYNNGAEISLDAVTVSTTGGGTYVLELETSGTTELEPQNLYVAESGGDLSDGRGEVIQGTGTVSISSTLYLGVYQTDQGTYSLSGGVLSTSGVEFVGYSGAGTLTQSGGTNSCTGALYVCDGGGSTGLYSLSGTGSLSVTGEENIGAVGNATYDQSSGTSTVAGVLNLGNTSGSKGAFNLSGGRAVFASQINLLATGSLSVSSTGTLVATEGAVTGGLPDGEIIGDAGMGLLNQIGGTNSVATALYLGAASGGAGAYSLSGASLLSVSGDEDVADSGSASPGSFGTFVQSSGSNSVSGGLHLASWADDRRNTLFPAAHFTSPAVPAKPLPTAEPPPSSKPAVLITSPAEALLSPLLPAPTRPTAFTASDRSRSSAMNISEARATEPSARRPPPPMRFSDRSISAPEAAAPDFILSTALAFSAPAATKTLPIPAQLRRAPPPHSFKSAPPPTPLPADFTLLPGPTTMDNITSMGVP